MDDSGPHILKFPASSGAAGGRPGPAASPARARTDPPGPTAEQGASQGPFASHVIDAGAMAVPPVDTPPTGESAGRNAEEKKGWARKLEAFKKLNSVAATLIVAAGFAGLVLWEMTRRTANEAEILRERRSTEYPYPVLVTHRMAETNPASGPGGTLDSGAESAPSPLPPSQVSPYPLEPGANNPIEFVPVPPPRSARTDEFADIPDLGGSADPGAGDDAVLDVIEARVRSRLRREGKMPPEEPEPGSIEDFRRRIESGKNSLVELVSGKGALP